MNEYLKEEYLTLREEIQTNLKSQKDWSIFAIATTVTILGFAINMKNSEYSAGLCCIPFVILFVAATKVKNYKVNCSNIAGYMITRIETPSAFFWETCFNEYRKERKKSPIFKITSFLETLEFTLTGAICIMLYINYSNHEDVVKVLGCNRYVLLVVLIIMLILITIFSANYWNMNPSDIEREREKWLPIIEKCTNKEKEKCIDEEK